MEKLKVFISQPMIDKTDEQILNERKRAISIIKKKYGFFGGSLPKKIISDLSFNLLSSAKSCIFLKSTGFPTTFVLLRKYLLFWDDIHCHHMIVLRKKRRQRQTHIPCTSYRNIH